MAEVNTALPEFNPVIHSSQDKSFTGSPLIVIGFEGECSYL